MNRKDVETYSKEVHFGYLATTDAGSRPHVRPLGIHTIYEDNLYFSPSATPAR
jgi:uncharacterized pyridoxamine 5'-phosphate oxidase family protein